MRALDCPRCGSAMHFLMRESFQKGDSGAWVGNVSHHFRGGFEMEVYACRGCGKLEFYLPEQEVEDLPAEEETVEMPDYNAGIAYVSKDGIPQVQCRHCGYHHDFDCLVCPRCDRKV